MYGLGSCGDPLTPTPAPHSTWLNRRDVREALHATMPEHPWGQRIGWDYTRTGASKQFVAMSEQLLLVMNDHLRAAGVAVGSLLKDVWPMLIQRYTSVVSCEQIGSH